MAELFPLEVLGYGPAFPVARKKEPRNLVSTYGDGYEQRSGDGINTIKAETPVRWGGLTKEEVQQADDFLTACEGRKGFYWTFPGDPGPLKYVCKTWETSLDAAGDSWSLVGTFVRDFNPG